MTLSKLNVADDTTSTKEIPIDKDEITNDANAQQAQPQEQSQITGYDPMTGQPIYANAQPQPQIIGYDPMTGQPIYANAQPQQTQPQIISYDPMTGQPIYANAQPQQQAQPQITGYDPMTGQPIYANAPQAAPAMNETAKPAKKKTGKIAAIIGGVAAAVAAIAIVVTVGTQLVLGKNGKILMATANTFKDIPLVEALNVEELLASEKCTMEVSGSAEGLEVSAVLSQDQKAKQISMAGDARYNGVGSDFAFYMDDTEIRLQAKDLLEPVLCYNYQETPTGYLAELMRDEGVDLSDMNRMLQQVMSQEDAQEAQKESMKIFCDQFKAMEFEKIDAETFEVNGKDRKCKGYTTEIDRYVLIDWVDAYEEWFTEYMGDYADTMRKYDMDYAELFDEMREELGDIDPYDLDIFVYKKQIAAVEMRSPRTKGAVVLEVQGGDYPLQNWEISTRGMDEKHQISQKGETNGKEEEIKWYVDREQIAELHYDHKTGDLEAGLKADGTNLFYMRGSLLRNKNGFECSLDDVQVEGQAVDVKGTIKLSNKAEIQKMDDAEQFDVGNATEAMWRDLIMESRLSSML